jgi:ABC-2 type transport system permease protein
MIRLLQIELNKLRTYRAFWVLTILYFVGLAGTLLSIQGIFNAFLDENVPAVMQNGMRWDFYSLPDGWHYMSWIASLFNFLLPIVVVIIVSAEFSYKTVRQNVITGMSRAEWMTGKLILMAFLALVSTLVLFLITLMLGLTHSEFSDSVNLFSQVGYILGYFIQTTGYLLFAMLLSIIIRNTGVVIGIMMIYSLFLERVIYNFLPDGAQSFFPLRAFSDLVSLPFEMLTDGGAAVLPLQATLVSLAYIGIFAGIGYWILKRRDL